jgi:hypothetical protein
MKIQQNNTDDGRYEIDTGRTDTNKLATVYSWNGMRQLSDKYWYGQGARVIQGTDAELFPPGLSDRTDLEIFIGQLCRFLFIKTKH